MSSNPLFGILLSIITYAIGTLISKKVKSPLANPLLIAVILSMIFLYYTGITYEDFYVGGEYINFLLGPATVALIVPLFEQIHILKKNFIAILAGILAGSVSALLSVMFFSKLFGFNFPLTISLLSKSITTSIAVELTNEFGGMAAITAVAIMLTGIQGAICGPDFLKKTGVDDPIATGIAIGTATHSIGTSRARKIGEIEGAMSGLSIVVAGIITVVLMPMIIKYV